MCLVSHKTSDALTVQCLFCKYSRQPSIRFLNYFFLLKTEIHTQILNTTPFLCNFRELRNMQNKIGSLINMLLWSTLKSFNFEVLYILKTPKIKTVLTSNQLVFVTRPTTCHLGAIRDRLGPVGRALRKF